MCGIIGVIGKQPAAPLVLDALRRLEYRGYDSAGIATLVDGRIERRRAQGKLSALGALLDAHPLAGNIGIGHTRWATHGLPTEANAHPHATAQVAVVHNGIIENFQPLRAELEKAGHVFTSQTDTEVVPQLITYYLTQGKSPREAVSACLKRLEGAFALGIIFADTPEMLYAARLGSPLAIGFGAGENYLGSDAVALAPLTRKICYLAEGDWAEITRDRVTIFDAEDRIVERPIKTSALTGAVTGKGDFRHFMQKEIFEQPSVVGQTLNVYYNPTTGGIVLPPLPFALADLTRITLVACGTSYYAALTARYWLESLARIPVDIDVASEFRYREPVMAQGGLTIVISQSGETADTLAALRYAKAQGQQTLAIVNSPESSMSHEAGVTLYTHAGPEIGVASTKAFTTQLTVLACFAIALASARRTVAADEMARLTHALAEVPARISEVLHHAEHIEKLAHSLQHATDMLYIGRGTSYAIAQEAALKMKEISYIHAEAYAAGEMKHGPIALIDESVPIVAIAPQDGLFDKTASNIQEAAARGGRIIAISDASGIARLGGIVSESITLPKVHPFVTPILYAIPVQLLAYHTAVLKGTDVDQPRNLAKSVTVE
ncbi:MAG: glutamine--fructose-6-phosphate transaminase (isomerizing) [Alphaproteobacteria bacterium]|nr:glutamine--fructose-6-phosphate transaminase (isomerizing) [Alphaproteobacteria bacterium]